MKSQETTQADTSRTAADVAELAEQLRPGIEAFKGGEKAASADVDDIVARGVERHRGRHAKRS